MLMPPRGRPAPAPDKLALLQRHPLFGVLGTDLLKRLSGCATMREVKRGKTIFDKGDAGTALFAVHAGTVKISVPSADGREAVFNLIREGEIFGEIALLDGRPRTAGAVAMTDCELMVIERRDFIAFVHQYPEVALKLIEVLCARLRLQSERFEEAIFLNLPARLARTLLRLSADADPKSPGGKLAITQREVSQLVGMSRESTNKQLRAWTKRQWLRLERGSIIVLEPDALAAIADAGMESEDE
jgi:CRP/FNR family transcriptional regulator, cyclic AMP receptor protein